MVIDLISTTPTQSQTQQSGTPGCLVIKPMQRPPDQSEHDIVDCAATQNKWREQLLRSLQQRGDKQHVTFFAATSRPIGGQFASPAQGLNQT